MNFRKIITLVLIIITIVVNAIVSANGLFGTEIGDLSNQYQTLANPAPYAFGIWSIIYLGLLAFGIAQLVGKQKAIPRPQLQYLVWINAVLNMAWLIAFHAQLIVLSVFIMLVLLGTLLRIVWLLYNASKPVNNWVKWVFEIYLGWISIATLVNISLLLQHRIQLEFSVEQQFWILFSLLVIVAIISTIIHQQKGKFALFSVVLVWAFIAIHIQHKADKHLYSFFPLLPLLIVIPDAILQLVKDIHQSNKS